MRGVCAACQTVYEVKSDPKPKKPIDRELDPMGIFADYDDPASHYVMDEHVGPGGSRCDGVGTTPETLVVQ